MRKTEWGNSSALQKCLSLFISLLLLFNCYGQERSVKGKVTDEAGNPLAGVSVLVAGTQNGTLTQNDGSFELRPVQPKDRLIFSLISHEQTQVVAGSTTISVQLKKSNTNMDEVVVVGYGNRKRSEVTGAITSVKASELTQTPIANLAQGLQGRVAGLQITQNNAAPGGSISVRLRGTNSINGSSEPLYVIDGIQIQNNTGRGVPGNQLAVNFGGVGGNANEQSPLSYINPDDIESIEVLKDASAAAIYGSQAANGVIIISTKRGRKGVSHISYDGYHGRQQVSKKLSLLNATEFAKIENEIFNQNRFTDPASLGTGTDWQDVIFRKAKIQNHQISFSGGNDATQYLLALNYFNQDGIVLSSKFDRFSLRLNLDHRVNGWLKAGTSTTLTRSINNRIQTGSINADGGALSQSLVGAALAFPPVLKPTLDSQQYIGFYGELRNPLSAAAAQDVTRVNTVLSNVYLDFTITQALKYRATLNAYSTNSLNDYYFPGSAFTPSELSGNGGLGGYGMKNNSNFLRLMHESILSYDKTILKDHTFRLTGVFSSLFNDDNNNYMTAQGFVNDATTNEAMHLARNFSINTNRSRDKLFSYLARVSYNFRQKYFIDLTSRADGSSKFGENNKFGFFPCCIICLEY
jgi:TonB-linked SusC/RagA family outer membrane protein